MQNPITPRGVALLAALAAVAASASATHRSLSDATWIPAPSAPIETSAPPPRTDLAPRIERVMPLEAAAIPPIPAHKPQPRVTKARRNAPCAKRGACRA